MAFQLLDLSDLITFQLKRVNFDKLQFKDELHLQRQLIDLDLARCQRQQQQNSKTEDYLPINKTPHLSRKGTLLFGMSSRSQKSCPAELSQVASGALSTRSSKSSPLFKELTGLNSSRTPSNVVFDSSSLHPQESIADDSRLSDQLTKDFKYLTSAFTRIIRHFPSYTNVYAIFSDHLFWTGSSNYVSAPRTLNRMMSRNACARPAMIPIARTNIR